MVRVWAVLAGLACATGGAAQEWVTPESCAVTKDGVATAMSKLAPPPVAELAIPNSVGRQWKVTTPDGKVSYLWGTFHSSNRLILDLPPELKSVLSISTVVLLEADPVVKSRAALEERQLQPGMWLAPSEPDYEKSFLEPQSRAWVEARLMAMGLPEGAMNRLTDAGLGSLLLGDPCEDFVAGVLPVQDHRILLAAYEADIPVAGLSAADAFVNDLSQPEQAETARAIAQIYAAYLNPEGFSLARAASVGLYRAGRIGDMIAGDQSYLTGYFGSKQARALRTMADAYLIAERNKRFLRAMKSYLDQGGALVAVGAFHLPGKDGLIEALRVDGYRVERVPTAGEDG